MPKLSVIVPVYNTEKYIDKCLDSIVNQTFDNIEVIVVNDGSPDNSEKIIKEYEKKYPDKIKYFKKENGGLSDTKNYGVEKATGEYITFVDSDDYLDKDLYLQLAEEMRNQIDLIKFKFIRVNEQYEEIEKSGGPVFGKTTGEKAFEILCFNDVNLEPSWLYIYKREFFIKNNFKFLKGLYHEDYGLTPFCIASAVSVISSNIYGYYYLLRENSITTDVHYEKHKKRAYDLLKHYDNINYRLSKSKLSKRTIENVKIYMINPIILKLEDLKEEDQKEYIKEIKRRNLQDNIKARNIKQFIKKILLKIDIKLYLKMRK